MCLSRDDNRDEAPDDGIHGAVRGRLGKGGWECLRAGARPTSERCQGHGDQQDTQGDVCRFAARHCRDRGGIRMVIPTCSASGLES
jgi:hypothetical protein